MEINNQDVFDKILKQNNALGSQVSTNLKPLSIKQKDSQNLMKDALFKRCENANSDIFKKHPHIQNNIIEIINQFFHQGVINERNMDFLQQKIQKEINFQLNKFRTNSRIGSIENVFSINHQKNSINTSYQNSPLNFISPNQQRDQQPSSIFNNINKQKRLLNMVVNNNGNSFNPNQNKKNYDLINHNCHAITQDDELVDCIITNNNLYNNQVGKPNLQISQNKQQTQNNFGRSARSSSCVGGNQNKHLQYEKIINKVKGSQMEVEKRNQFASQIQMDQFQSNKSRTEERDQVELKINNNQRDNYALKQRFYSNPRGVQNKMEIDNNESLSINIKQLINDEEKPKIFSNIAQNNILNPTPKQFQANKSAIIGGYQKIIQNKNITNENEEIEDEYMKELKKMLDQEKDYEKQRANKIQQKEKVVYNHIKKQWDQQIDYKKQEVEKEKELDKVYKKQIETLIDEEIYQNSIKKNERKRQALDDKQHVLQQIQYQKEQKERQRSIEIQEDLQKLALNQDQIKFSKDKERTSEINKIQQQQQMIVSHLLLSKNIRENHEKQNRLDELKRLKDQITQQHILDQRKDEEYLYRINKISKKPL